MEFLLPEGLNRKDRRALTKQISRKMSRHTSPKTKAITREALTIAKTAAATLDDRPCGWCVQAGRGPIPMGYHPKPDYAPCPTDLIMGPNGPMRLLIGAKG